MHNVVRNIDRMPSAAHGLQFRLKGKAGIAQQFHSRGNGLGSRFTQSAAHAVLYFKPGAKLAGLEKFTNFRTWVTFTTRNDADLYRGQSLVYPVGRIEGTKDARDVQYQSRQLQHHIADHNEQQPKQPFGDPPAIHLARAWNNQAQDGSDAGAQFLPLDHDSGGATAARDGRGSLDEIR